MSDHVSAALGAILDDCARGRLPPNVALMQMILAAREPGELAGALSAAVVRADRAAENAAVPRTDRIARIDAVADLIERHPEAFERVRTVAATVTFEDEPVDPAAAMARWASGYDVAARLSPEASVALYSFGDEARLNAATGEIMRFLRREGVLDDRPEVLDVGCGIGRLERALSADVRRIVGIDISPEMVVEARRRCSGLDNVEIHPTSGLDLTEFGNGRFDLVIVIDVMPYSVAVGATHTERLTAEFVRVLRPGGTLVVANYSYRGNLAVDRADVTAHAERLDLKVRRNGDRPFHHWDGAVFVLEKR